jgi:hypothetical protein
MNRIKLHKIEKPATSICRWRAQECCTSQD